MDSSSRDVAGSPPGEASDPPHAPFVVPAGALPVFVNAAAGRHGDAIWAPLAQALRDARVEPALLPVEPQQLRDVVAAAARSAPPIIGVSGGDGSLRAGAAALAGSGTALAVFPTGTLNHFAKRYHIASLDAAASAVAGGRIEQVPVGVVDDDVFLNTLTFGYYAEVVRRRERWRRWMRKWPAAAVAIASLLARAPRIHVILDVDGARVTRSTALLWIGVGWGAFPRAQDAVERRALPDLEVALLRTTTRRGLVAFMLRLIRMLVKSDRPVRDPALEILHARSIIVRGPEQLDTTMDGEIRVRRAPVYVGVRDHALRLVVPADLKRPR
jgi:diacylglycerol kinase family enzyme